MLLDRSSSHADYLTNNFALDGSTAGSTKCYGLQRAANSPTLRERAAGTQQKKPSKFIGYAGAVVRTSTWKTNRHAAQAVLETTPRHLASDLG